MATNTRSAGRARGGTCYRRVAPSSPVTQVLPSPAPGGIGGFQGAETAISAEPLPLHPAAVRVSSARAALARVLWMVKPTRVYVPDWICDTVLGPVRQSGAEVVRVPLGLDLLPIELPTPGEDELLLLLNAFGLAGQRVAAAAGLGSRLLVDATQALYQPPPSGCWGIASVRKFLGVPDGAMLWSPRAITAPSTSQEAVSTAHLVARAAGDPGALELYRRNEAALSTDYVGPSPASDNLLDRIDHAQVRARRLRNVRVLHDRLKAHNQLALPDEWPSGVVPLAYPFLPSPSLPHTALYARQIWAPCLWPERRDDAEAHPLTRRLARELLPLPCDHRYDAVHMHHIADVVCAAS